MSVYPYVVEARVPAPPLNPKWEPCPECDGAGEVEADIGLDLCPACDGERYRPCFHCGANPALAGTYELFCDECLRAADTEQEVATAQYLAIDENVERAVEEAKQRALSLAAERGCGDNDYVYVAGALSSMLKQALKDVALARSRLAQGEAKLADYSLEHAQLTVRR